MPDTPRTVREWMDGLNVADGIPLAGYFPDAFLDALIGAQGRVVYTEEDVERGAVALCDYHDEVAPVDANGRSWPRLTDDSKGLYQKQARAAITAAGGVVVDEVVELTGPLLWVKQNSEVVEMNDGDKLYIKRGDR